MSVRRPSMKKIRQTIKDGDFFEPTPEEWRRIERLVDYTERLEQINAELCARMLVERHGRFGGAA